MTSDDTSARNCIIAVAADVYALDRVRLAVAQRCKIEMQVLAVELQPAGASPTPEEKEVDR